MTAELRPLLARDRYTDEEWELASAGLCSWIISGRTRPSVYCRKPSDPNSLYRYCHSHEYLDAHAESMDEEDWAKWYASNPEER